MQPPVKNIASILQRTFLGEKHFLQANQPRSQDLYPGLGVGREKACPTPPPSQGKGPGNEVASERRESNYFHYRK